MTFFDIFSRTPLEPEEKITMVVDHREKNSLVISELKKQGVLLTFEQLAVADYLVHDVAVERKTITDLKSSIINKRAFSQLPDLKQYGKYLLLIEGIQDEDIYAGIIHENALRGFLLAAALSYRIPIIFTKNAQDTAKYLLVLAKKHARGTSSLRPAKIAHTKEEQLQFILEGFPNIGPSTAKKLLIHFGSIKNIINASEEDLIKILGKRASEFLKLVEQEVSDKENH